MNCGAARQLLLIADPAELEGRTESPLAEHLRTCPACRAAAERLLAAQRGLREVLEAGAASRGGAEAARQALGSAERRRSAARPLRVAVPLAAAAVFAGLWLSRRAPEPALAPPVREAALPARFSVTAPAGRSVVVLQPPDTSNVIVVWFF